MYNYTCLNPIAGVGLDLFSENYKKVEFKSIEVFEEVHNGIKSYLAKIVIEAENEHRKVEITIPRIDLLVNTSRIPTINHELLYGERFRDYTIDIFGTTLPLRRDETGNVYYEKVIKEYPQKMTLAEVEKKLGHKIELVSDK